MKCLSLIEFCEVAFVLATLFSLSWANSQPHPHESFLRCLTLRSDDAPSFSKLIYTPINSSYATVLNATLRNRRFATPTTPKPRVIVTPNRLPHIRATLYCARKHGLQLRTRSGGHDFEGLSYVSPVPFVILDMTNFRSIDIDAANKVAWIQAGAILGELYYKIGNTSNTLAFPAGVCPTVGLGGYISGGGYSVIFRKYGTAGDNVLDVQFIDVRGRLLDRKAMGEDLFWALQGGGGGSFGIVLAWKLRLVTVPPTVSVLSVARTVDQNATFLVHRWQTVAPNLPDTATSFLLLASVNSTTQDEDGKKTGVASFSMYFLGGADGLFSLMQERFPELGVKREDCIEMSWIQSAVYFARFGNSTPDVLLDRSLQNPGFKPSYKAKSDFVREPVSETVIEEIWSRLHEEDAKNANLIIVAWGGIMNEIADDATPFPHRAGNLYMIFYLMGWEQDDNMNSERYINWMRRLYSYMTPYVSKSPRAAYANYRDLDIGTNQGRDTSYQQASVWGRKYFINNFDRLVRVKTMTDPHNFFWHEQSIPSQIRQAAQLASVL